MGTGRWLAMAQLMDPVQRGMGDWFNKRPSLAADDREIGDWFRQKPLSQTAATSANDAEIDSWTAPAQRSRHEADWFRAQPSDIDSSGEIADWFRSRPRDSGAGRSSPQPESGAASSPGFFRSPEPVPKSTPRTDTDSSHPTVRFAEEDQKQKKEKVAAAAAAKAKEASDESWSTPQVFECTQPHPGVAYRHSPKFADKNSDGKGPKSTHESGAPLQKCVVGSDFVKSSEGITFMKCSTGRGWLPLHNPSGSINCFKHLGEHGEVDENGLRFQSAHPTPSSGDRDGEEEQIRKPSRAEGREGMVLTTPEGVRQMNDHTTRDKNPSAKEYTQQMVAPLAAQVEAYNREQARRPPMSAQEYVKHVRNREQEEADGEPVHDESANAYRHSMLGSAPQWFQQSQSPQRLNESAEEYRDRMISQNASESGAPHKMPSAADYTKEMLGPLVAQLEEYNSQHSHEPPESAQEYTHRMLLNQGVSALPSTESHQSASEYCERMLSDHSGAEEMRDVPSSKEYTEGMVAPLIKQLDEYNRQRERSYVPPESSHTYCKRMISSGGNPSLNSADGIRQMRAAKPRRHGVMSAADHVKHLESLQEKGQNTWRA